MNFDFLLTPCVKSSVDSFPYKYMSNLSPLIDWTALGEADTSSFMFISNNRASFYLRWKENLVKHEKV